MSLPRGRVLLINNMDFPQMGPDFRRTGSDLDVDNLEKLFTSMSFIFISELNLTAKVGITCICHQTIMVCCTIDYCAGSNVHVT